jgi:hypothetical protein
MFQMRRRGRRKIILPPMRKRISGRLPTGRRKGGAT